MLKDYVVADIATALEQRQYPTITVWNRLEGRPRRPDFARALKAEVRDAMFMLTRQWQMGEFRGDDAGSPATVKIQLATTRLRAYKAAHGATLAFDESLPLEARVERRALPLTMDGNPMSLDIRLLMGRQWLKMMLPIANYSSAFVAKYPFAIPDPNREEEAYICAHPEAWQVVAAVAGRRMDGGALFAYLTGAVGRHAWDGIPSILTTHHSAIDDAAKAFVLWFTTTFTQPPSKDEDAWLSDRLEYQFSCSAPEGASETVFDAEQYYQGRLDWYNLDVDPGRSTLGTVPTSVADPQATSLQSLIPVPIAYDGMPNTRWWAFEDRRVNFGAVTPATTDLGKLMFLEFGLVYANDWFMIPVTLDAGSLVRVRGMALTNVFGERFWIAAAGAGADDAWQRWSMFTLSAKGNEPGQQADTSLLLLPTVPKIQEGPALEEVLLVRDEVANMVWGVEKIISLPTGQCKPGAEAASETLAYHRRLLDEWLQANTTTSTAPEPAAPIIYKVMNSVPENWIPFISVHVPGDNRATQLQRAAMPRFLDGDPDPVPEKVRPRTMLLRDGLETPKGAYFLHEEEVPRAGAIVSQSYQRTRWTDGRVIVWLGARKQVGRGQGSSGLAFDHLVNAPAGQP
jgi:hypothetical protein